MNGVVAVANLRGGGEYGEDWHKAGSLLRKQNVFDDFQWAAKWLVNSRYTEHSRLAINGGSNGGLLVGACVNQAPELFACAMADVGVMDMLRFHKFTIGHAWRSDYGDPDRWEDFEYIKRYSPVHNVQSGRPYPHVLLLTSDHDDRVVPLHSYKYIAQLQHTHPNNPSPLLIRIETKAGHGAGKPTKKKIEEATDRFSFLTLAIDCPWKD
jgi:prolyl oligopeptidase